MPRAAHAAFRENGQTQAPSLLPGRHRLPLCFQGEMSQCRPCLLARPLLTFALMLCVHMAFQPCG